MTAPPRFVADSPAEACSALSVLLGEPLAGTAAVAEHWLCLEQPGPWGRDALAQSHLDTAVAAELTRRCEAAGIRMVLIRRPGSHADTHLPRPRQVYFASTRPGATRLAATTVLDPKELLDLDLAAMASGGEPRLRLGRRARRAAPAGLHQRPARRLLRTARAADRRSAGGAVSGRGMGVHPHRRSPVRPDRARTADRVLLRSPRRAGRRSRAGRGRCRSGRAGRKSGAFDLVAGRPGGRSRGPGAAR